MADITASTALRDFIAAFLSTAGGSYMWATLHSSISAIDVDTVYSATGLNELPTGDGYTAQGKTCGTIALSAGVLDTPDVVWDTEIGDTLTAACCCIWINDSNSIVGASLVCMDDSVQTASNGGTMTAGLINPITIPTPA